ncbi:MAG: DUF58 domain-containing protein [Candidatus Heimdallarchaeota archaeon]|nr:DUF58 domain-containing protein [Candidatus Heimdallarchaeota archaeon]
MFTPKLRWSITLFFIILLAGIGFEEWTYLLALIPIGVIILSYFVTTPPEKLEIEIERVLEQTRFQVDEYVEIILNIRNRGRDTIDALEILDELPPQVSLKNSSNHIITSLEPGEETQFRYKISCDYRGRWVIGPTHIRARNFLDSAFIYKLFEETKTNVVVIPNFEMIKDIPFRTKYPKISDGPFHSKFKGEGLDFAGVREYQYSDSLGRINWPTTAKYGRLFTNEYELFRTADLLLVLDASDSSVSILDEQIKAVMSLSEHFLRFKCRVGLVIIRDTVDWFELSSSRQQLLKFTEKLVDVQASKINNYNILNKRLINCIDKYYPLNCLTVFISPLINNAINQILIDSARRRRNSFFLVPSIIASEWRFVKDKEEGANLLVHQELLLRREIELLKVIQQGLIIFEWDVSVPFSVFMNKLKQVSNRRGVR